MLRAAAPLQVPPLALPAAGRDACGWHERVGSAFPERPNPRGLVPIGGLAPSPLGSPRQEREGSQADSFWLQLFPVYLRFNPDALRLVAHPSSPSAAPAQIARIQLGEIDTTLADVGFN